MGADILGRYTTGLQAYVAEALPGRVGAEVLSLEQISSGWESDVYAFDLVGRDGREPLVLRLYPGRDASEKSAREFDAVRRLHAAGYPVPAVLSLEQSDSLLGRPFIIMERIEGHGMWHEMFHGTEAQQRSRFELFCRLLVQLHALDCRALAGEDAPAIGGPYAFVDRYLGLFRAYCARFQQPGYLRILEWLSAHRDLMSCDRPAPIHWDYHPENILIRDDGSAIVIDWTQFEISDPRFDLAWTMTLVGCAESGDVRERILQTYQLMSPYPIVGIEPFEVFACAKRLASVTISLAAGAGELGMRPGSEEMMRRQIPTLARVHDRLQDLTGQRIPEVDTLFEAC